MPRKKIATRGRGDRSARMRPTITITDGTTMTKTWVYNGDYGDLEKLALVQARSAKTVVLQPEPAAQGTLTVTQEEEVNLADVTDGKPVVELIWQELRKSITEHPHFDSLAPHHKKEIIAAAEDPEKTASDLSDSVGTPGVELYNLLASGVTEYSIGVPVVRSTTPRARVVPKATWVRSKPPLNVPGEWQFLLTAVDFRKEGRSRSLVEEWTGATIWDPILYP